jgi:hypothetical protein
MSNGAPVNATVLPSDAQGSKVLGKNVHHVNVLTTLMDGMHARLIYFSMCETIFVLVGTSGVGVGAWIVELSGTQASYAPGGQSWTRSNWQASSPGSNQAMSILFGLA